MASPSTDKTCYSVCVLAHNEEDRIVACLSALALDSTRFRIFVLVNGSTDKTAELAKAFLANIPNTQVISLAQAGKSKAWNSFIYDYAPADLDGYFFIDGDTVIKPGSLDIMASMLENKELNAISAPPLNGRNAQAYRHSMFEGKGLFGDLYCLSGNFVRRIQDAGFKLPDDLIGDDGMVRSWALTNLGTDHDWDTSRLEVCLNAGFYSEVIQLNSLVRWKMQFKRMVNYSERRFQNFAVIQIMRSGGVIALPTAISKITSDIVRLGHIRKHPIYFLFDILALRRIRKKATQQTI
jgi:glycosyltransferase involved in cell wall biosynthesis